MDNNSIMIYIYSIWKSWHGKNQNAKDQSHWVDKVMLLFKWETTL